jgi:hypothetical protein
MDITAFLKHALLTLERLPTATPLAAPLARATFGPVSVEREIDGQLCVLSCQGSYSADELIAALDALLSDPNLPENPLLLLDLRESASVLRRPIPELRRIAYYFTKHAHRFDNRCALLVSGAARYGLMRMASMWIDLRGVEARVFRDEAESREWLKKSSGAAGTR